MVVKGSQNHLHNSQVLNYSILYDDLRRYILSIRNRLYHNMDMKQSKVLSSNRRRRVLKTPGLLKSVNGRNYFL
ncbi:hypothetical protein Trydic_g15942 [Trypoxylus dichotomus]